MGFCPKPNYFFILKILCSFFTRPNPICSFLLLAQKKRTKEKGSHKSFLGLSFYRLPTHYNSFALLTQTVMLTYILRFATSKMLIFFQKRFEGIVRLTAIRVFIFWQMSFFPKFSEAVENPINLIKCVLAPLPGGLGGVTPENS